MKLAFAFVMIAMLLGTDDAVMPKADVEVVSTEVYQPKAIDLRYIGDKAVLTAEYPMDAATLKARMLDLSGLTKVSH
jgi:hypothetical protein